jgi:alpha-tubulin suppressor-like RCC1 family protein
MRPRTRSTFNFLRLLAGAALVGGCGGSDITGPLETVPVVDPGTGGTASASAATLTLSDGMEQSGVVNTTAPSPLEVRVLDDKSAPVAGAVVTFTAKGGRGTVNATATTGLDGLASTPFRFGTQTGLDSVVASLKTAKATLSATFVLRATPTGPKTLSIVSGATGLQDTVGMMLKDTLAVAVRDSFNNAIPNVVVTFTPAAGSGTISLLDTKTDTAGRLRARWTLGNTLGTQTVSASVAGLGTPVTFTANAIGAGVVSVRAASGDAQTGSVGSQLTQPLVVQAIDGKGNPIAGAVINFGTVLGGGSLSKAVDTTDAQGLARTRLTLGTLTGTNTVSATSGNGKTTTLTARAVATAPKSLSLVNGNNGQDTVRATLKDTLIVAVRDSFNNAIPGITIAWTVTSGGGSVTVLTQPTDSAGRARALWTLGTAMGANTLTASAAGLPTLTFNATALGAPASTITIVGGNNQSALVNQYVGDSITVRVEDAYGNTVVGAPISWVASNGGTAQGKQATSGTGGIASATWKLGAEPGPQTVRVTVNGRSVTFNATATLIYRTVDAGGFNACGITPSAQAYCWGYNGDGQLGTGNNNNRNISTPIFGELTFRQISGGRYHTCGITLSGIGYCWGDNHDGRLGTGDQTSSLIPKQVATGLTFQSIAAGRVQSCGLSLAGLVYCWGFNQEGEVGARIPPADSVIVVRPRPISGQSFKSLSVGGLHACAIDINDQMYCWGYNNYGQLGTSAPNAIPWTLDNTKITDSTGKVIDFYSLPVPVQSPAGVSGWKSVAAGYRHTCAIANTGVTYCWGENESGQLGDVMAPNANANYAPTPVSGTFVELSAGFSHTCAIDAAGTGFCWGSNADGKLGNTGPSIQPMPTAVSGGKFFQHISAGEKLSCGITNAAGGQTANVAYCWGDNSYGELGDGTNNSSSTPTKIAFQP